MYPTESINERQSLLEEAASELSGLYDCSDKFVQDMLRQLYKVDYIRFKIVKRRLDAALAARALRFCQVQGTPEVQDGAIQHNLEGLFNDLSSARSARLIRPLSVLEEIRPLSLNNRRMGALEDIDTEVPVDLLCVGPRTEAEILLLWAYGFKLEHITAIDLMSYSQLVSIGDMHDLPYKDESFDVIFSSCTLFYSDIPQRAAAEFRRVARPGAIFALMQDVSSPDFLDYSISRWGFPVYDPVSMAYLLFPGGNFQILYSSFCKPNLNMVNGASSALIVKSI